MKEKKISTSAASSQVDLQEIERLLRFMEDHGLEELEYANGGLHIHLRRPSPHPVSVLAPPRMGAPAAHGEHPSSSAPQSAGGEAAPAEDLHVIKSPIVGTYYGAPTPGAEPYVKAGARVEAGQVLCIIEAMKLMNEIESDVAGEVVRIHVENGQPVEYGELLFAIRPSRKSGS